MNSEKKECYGCKWLEYIEDTSRETLDGGWCCTKREIDDFEPRKRKLKCFEEDNQIKMEEKIKDEDGILDSLFDDELNERYNKLVEAIGTGNLALIHFKHYKDFLVDLDKLKKEAQLELIKKQLENLGFIVNNELIEYKYIEDIVDSRDSRHYFSELISEYKEISNR